MEDKSVQSQLMVAAGDLGIPVGKLRTMLAPQLATIFKGHMGAIQRAFPNGVVKRLSAALGDEEERKVRSHLNGESKAGRRWTLYRDWFAEFIPLEVPQADVGAMLRHL